MDLLRTRAELERLESLRGRDRSLVLVPTMGALHEGHLALVRRANELGSVVVSIFVNPAQFGQGEDFGSYPRDLERDLDLLRPLDVAAVFAPPVEEMYPHDGGVSIVPGPAASGLCGADRPGHFAGVLTVVAKLLNLVRPDVAVFGRKDAQQCLVIAEMVRDLAMPVHLIDHPTVREADELAMSSRNVYLSADARRRALSLSRALYAARDLLRAGERDLQVLHRQMRAELNAVDVLEYVAIRSVPELTVPDPVDGRLLLAVAARVDSTRLIDNLVLQVDAGEVREASLLDFLEA